MENKLFKHIEFLLPQYNCVVIPDFGGFIMNMEPASIDEDGMISPPSYYISFNQDLKHNDGLLASNIQQSDSISYESACRSIRKMVESMRKELSQQNILICGNIGKLTADENQNLSFAPNSSVMHPELMGLTSVRLPLLVQIDNEKRKEKRSLNIRYAIGTAAAAAAALLLLVAPSIKVGNLTDTQGSQQATFVDMLTQNRSTSANSLKLSSTTASTISAKNTDASNSFQTENITASNNTIDNKKTSTRIYYIIIGGEDTKGRADRLLSKIQSEDFPAAQIVETTDRYRVYVKSFEDKSEAESFLERFRLENPKFQTAWLFSKRASMQ
jgi:hypothetical protein